MSTVVVLPDVKMVRAGGTRAQADMPPSGCEPRSHWCYPALAASTIASATRATSCPSITYGGIA